MKAGVLLSSTLCLLLLLPASQKLPVAEFVELFYHLFVCCLFLYWP